MSKRLVTSSLALAFATLATPTLARPFNDHGPDFQQQYYDGERRSRSSERDSDDGDRVTPRAQRRQAGKREHGDTGRRERKNDLAARSMTRNAGGAGTSRTCLTGPTPEGFGPMRQLIANMSAERLPRLRADVDSYHRHYETSAGLQVRREYLITLGTRR